METNIYFTGKLMYIKGHAAVGIILHLFAVDGVHVADADFATTLSTLHFI